MDVLGTIGSLPKKIEDITSNISEGAESLDKMVDKMDNALNNVETKNPVSSAIVGGLSTITGALDRATDVLNNAGKDIKDLGSDLAQKIQPVSTAAQKVQKALQDLNNCRDVISTSALVVNAIVDSCSGHFHPRTNEQVLNKFDAQWDSWANIVNGIYKNLSPSKQENILESLAKGAFGDNIFYLGSAIKNESAGIFGGIADFEDALHVFGGSYRNPIEAAKKIETGVKGIINATERVANSINNMFKIYQKGMGQEVTGNPIFSYIGNLHNTKAVGLLNKTLTLGGGTATLFTDVSSLQSAIKSKNIGSIYSAGKKTISDAKTVIGGLKNADKATKVTSLAKGGTPTGGAAPVNQSKGVQQQSTQNDDENDSSGSDSYVCSGATMKCIFGDKEAKLTVFPDRTVFLTGQPMANISDHMSMSNIATFGKCRTLSYPPTASATAAALGKLTPMPCVPGTQSPWMNGKNDYLIKGQPALLKTSICKCIYGGIITITHDGQTDTGAPDMSRISAAKASDWIKEDKELFSADEDEIELTSEESSVLDGIQLALDAAGFIPGWGAIADLINAAISAARGDMVSAGLSLFAAIPFIGDAVAATKLVNKGVKLTKTAKATGVTVGKGEVRLLRRNVPADKANAVFTQKSKKPPFGSDLIVVKLTEEKTFVRVGTKNNIKGRWMIERSEIEGLSRKEIKDKFALPQEPDELVEVTAKKGAKFRKSIVGGNSFGKGGGIQYYVQENSFSKVQFSDKTTKIPK